MVIHLVAVSTHPLYASRKQPRRTLRLGVAGIRILHDNEEDGWRQMLHNRLELLTLDVAVATL